MSCYIRFLHKLCHLWDLRESLGSTRESFHFVIYVEFLYKDAKNEYRSLLDT